MAILSCAVVAVGDLGGVLVYTCGCSAQAGTWPHRGKARRREGAEHSPCRWGGALRMRGEERAWEQVWVKESGPVSAPHREGDTVRGLVHGGVGCYRQPSA